MEFFPRKRIHNNIYEPIQIDMNEDIHYSERKRDLDINRKQNNLMCGIIGSEFQIRHYRFHYRGYMRIEC